MEIRAKCDFDEEMYKQLYRATMAKNEKPAKALRLLFKMRTEQNSVLFCLHCLQNGECML